MLFGPYVHDVKTQDGDQKAKTTVFNCDNPSVNPLYMSTGDDNDDIRLTTSEGDNVLYYGELNPDIPIVPQLNIQR